MVTADVIVVGGGLHGCSAALQLAKRGASVVLVEKDYIGRHASGANAGGVRQLGRVLAEIPLSVASMEMWHGIEDLVDDHCGFESHGQVKLAESEADLETCRARASALHTAGFEHEEVIDEKQLRELVPAAAPHVVGGMVSRADGAALPFRTVQAFRNKAERLGARIIEGVAVSDIRRDGRDFVAQLADGQTLSAPKLVNAAGAWAGRIAERFGEPVPLEAVAPMLMITERRAPFLKPVVGATSRTLSFKQFANGTVLIGGGYLGRAEPDTNRTILDYAKLGENARTVRDLFPVMHDARIIRCWAGIEARMADGIPVIGPSRTEDGLFHSFGYSLHGFQLGPICGSIIGELVTTGQTNLPISPFSIRRFAPSGRQSTGF
ncbi:FAD-binding oxidoreductase [Tianweitania sp. BSSL-BM11]|uniref:FAD-binding oxidoreductase n=1 Tax=Tianweitania aestuarii TaxID=2814886 RepID=A0ABS5RR79_9HYPH|nr:FAD-binding oxidoreductase [Tianweitania aestuarii]MBS9719558.1 FAD-binding oxidoreductase [Tianweitania aestuarii]